MKASNLEELWEAIPATSTAHLGGLRVPDLPTAVRIYVALDDRHRRQLLVAISGDVDSLHQHGMHGLDVTTDELQVGNAATGRYIQLICLNAVHHTTFTGLCQDIITAVHADPEDPRGAVTRCLDRWRSFWMVDPAGLTKEGMIGLFGELWFLYRWLGTSSPETIQRWTGPEGARHDFQFPSHSVEVKTAVAGPNHAPMHRIANLEQLEDPEEGRLLMFSLHLADDALAKNNLPSLIATIRESLLHDSKALNSFQDKLAKTGYSPAQADKYLRPLRVIAEDLFEVAEGFPRLTRHSLENRIPLGVDCISYSLSIAACGPWRIASNPNDPRVAMLRGGLVKPHAGH